MAEYKYDEEGGQFLTFVLTFLLLILLPLTYSLFSSRSSAGSSARRALGPFHAKGQKGEAVKKLNRRSITNPKISFSLLLVFTGWVAVAYLVQRIANAAANSSHSVYDPFSILGIVSSATEKEIKKHYKKLSIKFHPDKIRLTGNQTKEDAEETFIQLTKAYKSLTDETIRKNFELYGHPDGRQEMSMGIALPKWVVESQNNIWVLGVYGVIFAIGMPYLVARWWYGSRSRTKDGIINSTATTFFQTLRDDTPAPRVLALLSISEEFRDEVVDRKGLPASEAVELAKVEEAVRERLTAFSPRWQLLEKFRSPSIRRSFVLLHAYLLRVPTTGVALTKFKYRMAPQVLSLLSGLLSMALAHNWLEVTTLLMEMHQAVVQAVPIAAPRKVAELMQLPNIDYETATRLVKDLPLVARHGIEGLWATDDALRKKVAGLSDKQYAEMIDVAGQWPTLEVIDATFKVTGERLVTTGALVNFEVQMRLLPPATASPKGKTPVLLSHGVRPETIRAKEALDSSVVPDLEDTEGLSLTEKDKRKETKEGKTPGAFVRAPYLVEERKPRWWVFLGDAKLNKVVVQPTAVSDIGPNRVRTHSIQFQAPSQAGTYTFHAVVKSDAYLGSDAYLPVTLKVEDPEALEEADDDDDDISEPDEDTLAGQMAIMRGGKVKSAKAGDDEDEDDDDSDEEEEEEDEVDDDDSDSDRADIVEESDSDSD